SNGWTTECDDCRWFQHHDAQLYRHHPRALGVIGEPRLGLFDLGQVGVGVLPTRQEIFVSLRCLGRVAGHGVRPGKSVEGVAALGPLFQGLLKGLASFVPLMSSQVRLTQAFLFRTVKMRWFGVAKLLLLVDGFLKELNRLLILSL